MEEFEEEIMKELKSRRKSQAKFHNIMYLVRKEEKEHDRIFMNSHKKQVETIDRLEKEILQLKNKI